MHYFKNKYSIAVLLFFMPFLSCKKVLDTNIKNVAPQIVITGEVNNLPGPYTVTISKTVNYTNDNVFPPVSGAVAYITGNGVTDTLTETIPGTYTTHSIKGVPGGSYTLYVAAEGQTYTATSVMPQPVSLDSVGYKLDDDKKINGVVHFQDQPGIANYYQFVEFANGKRFKNSSGWSVFEDRLSDGRYIVNTLENENIGNDSADIKFGDTLTVQINCTDKNVYDYLNTLSQITNGNPFQSPAPANPLGNISNNALGYFTAQTVQLRQKIIR